MQLTPEKMPELVPAKQYFEDPATEPQRLACVKNYRRFKYLVYEAEDRSFVDDNAALFIGNTWYYWPAAAAVWAFNRAQEAVA